MRKLVQTSCSFSSSSAYCGAFQIALHVREEDVLPALAAQGPGFQLAHVDAVAGQQIQHGGEGPGLVRQGEEQGGLVRAGMARHRGAHGPAQLGAGGLRPDDDESASSCPPDPRCGGRGWPVRPDRQTAVADGRRAGLALRPPGRGSRGIPQAPERHWAGAPAASRRTGPAAADGSRRCAPRPERPRCSAGNGRCARRVRPGCARRGSGKGRSSRPRCPEGSSPAGTTPSSHCPPATSSKTCARSLQGWKMAECPRYSTPAK